MHTALGQHAGALPIKSEEFAASGSREDAFVARLLCAVEPMQRFDAAFPHLTAVEQARRFCADACIVRPAGGHRMRW